MKSLLRNAASLAAYKTLNSMVDVNIVNKAITLAEEVSQGSSTLSIHLKQEVGVDTDITEVEQPAIETTDEIIGFNDLIRPDDQYP